jgi:Major Facilitator Superfamily/Tetracyclin repressor-like, C-terminal domain
VGSAVWWRTPAVVIVCGCLIAMITYGLRTSFGLFVEPLSEGRGWSREVFALAIAIQNILWGLGQPVAGAIADRYGSARVLAVGGAIYALGVALMAVSTTPLALNLTAGVLVGLGLSGGSFTIVIAAFSRLVPEDRRSWSMGVATAAVELAPHDEEVAGRISRYVRRTEDAFERALVRGRAAGEVPANKDPKALARFLVSTLHGVRVLARAGVDRAVLDDSVRTALEVLR